MDELTNPLVERRDYSGKDQLQKTYEELQAQGYIDEALNSNVERLTNENAVKEAMQNSLEGKMLEASQVSKKRRNRNWHTRSPWLNINNRENGHETELEEDDELREDY